MTIQKRILCPDKISHVSGKNTVMPPIRIQGQIERITYVNEDNNYTIAKLNMRGRRDLVTILGTFPSLNPGETVKLLGEWTRHPKFGEQFKVATYEIITPATARGIQKYLGSGLIKGIGPVMAKRIVETFDVDALDIIDHNIERLSEVPGIGPGRIKMIRTAWADQKEISRVMIFLQEHGVSTTYAAKIYKQYGRESISIVKHNPYRLASDIFGIGFLTADRIAKELGIPRDSLLRAGAGILYALDELSNEGHVYYPYESLIEKCKDILKVERDILVKAFATIASEQKIVIEDLNTDPAYFRENHKAVYLAPFHVCETGIARRMLALTRVPKQLKLMDMDKVIQWIHQQLHITLAEQQRKAIEAAIREKVMIVTGGPGTGKTTIIKSIISIYDNMGKKVMLTAPTGRAAKRLAETTDHEAKTIHRLLEFRPRQGSFKKNENDPLETDVLIIDEASMIDTVLMYQLLKALPPFATLILVGDINQIPSVGAGNVLKDLIASEAFKVVELNKIFRQAKESFIVTNAHRINQGEMPLMPQVSKKVLTDFYFIKEEDAEKVAARILDMVKIRIPHRFGFDPIADIQVLTPMYKGVVGATNLNAELQRELNKNTVEVTRGGGTFKLHDKVMQVRNNYDKEVFNGDIGKIVAIDPEEQEVSVNFDGRNVSYDFSELDELVLAYAISVHKSQGSEYPAVIIPVMTQHYVLLQRNLLYTAVTRAKRLVVLIGTKKALAIAVNNDKVRKRYTRLAKRIRSMTLKQ